MARKGRDQAPAGALGCLDGVAVVDGGAAVSGWLLHPRHAVDRIRVLVDGAVLGEAPVTNRPDVAVSLPGVPHAARSGFHVSGALAAPASWLLRVETLGLVGGRAVIAAEEYWPAAAPPALPVPGPALMERVSGSRDGAQFDRAGLGIATQLLAAVQRHLPHLDAPRVLDWGSGCGRATRFMPHLWPGLHLAGCDIDPEAVGWCTQHIPDLAFHVTAPFPPLPFADGAFDAVVAASVMTHLARPVQRQWLTEIRRVLAPGGIFVASVHGPLAALPGPAVLRKRLARRGFVDAEQDRRLDGIAPANYYRATYQTEAWTRRIWGRVLPVAEYRAGGLTNYQDLVVLRRPPLGPLRRLLAQWRG